MAGSVTISEQEEEKEFEKSHWNWFQPVTSKNSSSGSHPLSIISLFWSWRTEPDPMPNSDDKQIGLQADLGVSHCFWEVEFVSSLLSRDSASAMAWTFARLASKCLLAIFLIFFLRDQYQTDSISMEIRNTD